MNPSTEDAQRTTSVVTFRAYKLRWSVDYIMKSFQAPAANLIKPLKSQITTKSQSDKKITSYYDSKWVIYNI